MDINLPTKIIILKERLGDKCLLEDLTSDELENIVYEIATLWGYKDLIEDND